MYGEIKSLVFDALPLSYDATLIVLGLIVWLMSGLLFRLPMTKLVCIVPIVFIAVAIEIADVMLLAQAPIRAVSDFAFFVLPVTVLVFFQHQGWVRA